jgi:hypothetical protein
VARLTGFKARAGALPLFYSISDAERQVLRALLAEAATGVDIQEIREPPGRRDAYRLDLFNDSYLLEPADPELGPGAPVGPETTVKATPAGRELVPLSKLIERWLARRPAGGPERGVEPGMCLAPVLTAWSSTLLHAVAAEPLGEDGAAEAVPTLPPRIAVDQVEMLAAAGLVEEVLYPEGEIRYAPNEWLRRVVAPLLFAVRIELRHPADDVAPLAVADVEAIFRLALPLVRLRGGASGSCALAVELKREVSEVPVGVTAQVEDGRVVAVDRGLADDAGARASGDAAGWLDALIDGAKQVEASGDSRLARDLVKGLRKALFGKRRR